MKTTKKRSENAKAVANKVVEKVRKGEKVVLGDIIREQGYKEGTASHPQKVTLTKSYQEEIRSHPYYLKVTTLLDKTLEEMDNRELSHEALFDLNNMFRNLAAEKNTLEGRGGIQLNVEIDARKYNSIIQREARSLGAGEPEQAD